MGWELFIGNVAEIASQWIRDKIMPGSGWALTTVTFGQAQKFCTYSEEAVTDDVTAVYRKSHSCLCCPSVARNP